MNLVRFLFIGSLLSLILGEFGKYPFGSSSAGAITLTDILATGTTLAFIIWKISAKKRIKLGNINKLLLLFWGVGFLSLISSLQLFPWFEVLQGSLYLFRFIIYSSLLIMVSNLKKDGQLDLKLMKKILIRIGVVLGILGILQYFFISDFEGLPFYLTEYGFDPHKYRLTSTFLDPNFFGVFLVIIFFTTLLSFLQKKAKLTGLLLGLFLIEIIVTYSRTAYLMFFITGITLFIKNWQNLTQAQIVKISLTIFFSLTILFIFSPRTLDRVIGAVRVDQSSKERIESWSKGWEIFKSSPIIGVGFNNTRLALSEYNLLKVYSEEGGHSGSGIDSSFIFVLVTTGIIGFLVYLLFWLAIIKKIWPVKNLETQILVSLIIGLLISSQFINALFFPSIMVVIFSLVGTLYFLPSE